MASLVSFDRKGVFGPAMTLVYVGNLITLDGCRQIADLLQNNLQALTKNSRELSGKDDFCEKQSNKTTAEKVNSLFLKTVADRCAEIRKTPITDPYKEKIITYLVPPQVNRLKEAFGEEVFKDQEGIKAVKEFTAHYLEMLSDEEIDAAVKAQTVSPDELNQERIQIGQDLMTACQQKNMTKKAFNAMLALLNTGMEGLSVSEAKETASFSSRYFSLASKSEHPVSLIKDIAGKLDTVFRKKFFPEA